MLVWIFVRFFLSGSLKLLLFRFLLALVSPLQFHSSVQVWKLVVNLVNAASYLWTFVAPTSPRHCFFLALLFTTSFFLPWMVARGNGAHMNPTF